MSFLFSTDAALQTLSSTKIILEKHGNASTKSKMDSTPNESLMLPVPRFLHTFPKVTAHRSVDIYAVFRFESVQVLYLGFSRLSKEFLINMWNNDRETKIFVRKLNGDFKLFH